MTINDLKGKYSVVSPSGGSPSPSVATQPITTSPGPDLLQRSSDIATSIFPGTKAIGEGLGTAFANIGRLAKGQSPNIPVNVPKMAGGILQAGALPVSLGAAAPASIGRAALQYGALGAVSAGGASLENGNNALQVGKDSVTGGAINAVAGGAFNLLGKGISAVASKAGPSALSFTSGVPKNAIDQAIKNPTVAKEGVSASVNDVRSKAVSSLQSLHSDLAGEFKAGLSKVNPAPVDGASLGSQLFQNAKAISQEYKVGLQGATPSFQKSAIVSAGEQRNVKEAFNTIKTWSDFSPQGMQGLSARIGALKKWDEAGTPRASAIVGRIYSNVNDAIKTNYPDLASLRTNYAKNRKVLDEIGNVLSAGKDKPTQIQASVSRLDNLFSQNKDEYLNAIKQLSDRSGVDYLSLLAGGEFQKVLPDFIRGLGGGGAVGVGASLLNPYLLLLAPLFSPRAVGGIVNNAPKAANATSKLTRAITTQAIRAAVPTTGSQPPK